MPTTLVSLGINAPSGGDELRFTKDVIIEGSVTADNDVTITEDMTVAGDLGADEIKRPKWNVTRNIIVQIDDISSAGYMYFVAPLSGYITKIYSVYDATITGTAIISLASLISGEIKVATSTITIGAGAAGVVDSMMLDYTDKEDKVIGSVAIGDVRILSTDGGSTNAAVGIFTVEFSQDPW